MYPKVSIVKCETYSEEQVYAAVVEALEKIDFHIPKNKKVLLKPNILAQNKPEQHSITHYSVVGALCRLLRENGCHIQIGESIAFFQKGLTKRAFISSGIAKIAKKYDAELIPFDEEELVKIMDKSLFLKELYIPKKVLEADMIINIPKLKTHSAMRFSGAIKNNFGILPGGYKQLRLRET